MSPEERGEVTVAIIPAGAYIVGDPCYFVPDDQWQPWLEAANYTYPSREHVLHAPVHGHPVVGVSTAYGDGVYVDEQGREYPVDAGLIGLTPIALAATDWRRDLGHLVTFDTEIACRYDDGKIHLGPITINTGDEEEDETEWCESCGLNEVGWNAYSGMCDDCANEQDADEDQDEDGD